MNFTGLAEHLPQWKPLEYLLNLTAFVQDAERLRTCFLSPFVVEELARCVATLGASRVLNNVTLSLYLADALSILKLFYLVVTE